MTLNAKGGASPSPHLHLSRDSQESSSTRRRNTVGSPTSAVFQPGIPLSYAQAPTIIQPPSLHFLPLLAPPTSTGLRFPEVSLATNAQNDSLSRPSASPHRRRQSSRSPERACEHPHTTAGAPNGCKNTRQHHLAPKSSVPNMPGKRNDAVAQTVAGPRGPFRGQRAHYSNPSTLSTSLPSTPNHLPRLNGVSRSPSPPMSLLDSPRSAASEPVSAPYKVASTGCKYETALVNARRRMPYSLGFDRLNNEKPRLEKLTADNEEKLTKEMEEQFEKLKPSVESETRRRKFLDKLGWILNEGWPGYDTKVHAFGSTENHLCMNDSDVDVCITTNCKEIESTCKLASALARRGMERVVCVPGAKVPIVKIWDPEYKVACDMNVNNTLALDNTRMIKTYVEIDDRVRPLALIIKHWTKERVLNDAATGGTLSSYTWICMILNFLQTREPPILPSLHMRPHKKKPPNHGVDVSFDDDIDKLRGFGKQNHETIGELLFAFFKKYGHEFDYETKVISVRLGRLISKEEKKWQFLQNNRLCVEEPFNTVRNLGNTADDSSMRGIHLEFRRAHRILSEKASLAECCERFEFPQEETHHIPVAPPSRPVTLTRSNSNHGRNRNGYSRNQRTGQMYQYNGSRGPNRRSSGSAAFNAYTSVPHQFYSPDVFNYMPMNNEQLIMLQAHLHAQAHAHAQFLHAHSQGQAHYHGQNGPQTTPPISNATGNNPEVTPFHLASWPYLAHIYGMNALYPGFGVSHETSTAPTSPPKTPASVDARPDLRHDGSRLGLGRGARGDNLNTGSRSRSQPPPLYPANGYGRGPPLGVGRAASEDDEYGDHSSNGNPPETPPEEEPEEYVGYYSIGGPLQPDVAVVDPQNGEVEEPFLEQKTVVDSQKRYPQEQLPLLSRKASPLSMNRQSKNRDEVLPPLALRKTPTKGDHKPAISTIHSLPSRNPFDSSDRFDGAVDSLSEVEAAEQRQFYTQGLLEARNRAPRPEVPSLGSSHDRSPANGTSKGSALNGAHCASISEDDVNDNSPPRVSPGPKHRAATQQLSWIDPRVGSDPILKTKGLKTSPEDLSHPLTPVPEVRTPSPASTRRRPESKNKSNSNGSKVTTKGDPAPPTPAPEKGNQRTRGRSSGPRATNNNSASEVKSETKSDKGGWKKTQYRKQKKRAQSSNKQESIKESERKGG